MSAAVDGVGYLRRLVGHVWTKAFNWQQPFEQNNKSNTGPEPFFCRPKKTVLQFERQRKHWVLNQIIKDIEPKSAGCTTWARRRGSIPTSTPHALVVSPTAVAWISCRLWVHRRRFAQWFFPCGQSYPRNQNNHMAAPVKVAKQQTTPELPNPASGTYTLGNPPERSETVRNPPFGNFRNLPPKPTHTPEPCGTFRNLPPEPTPFYTGTLRNLLEPAPGTYTSTHRNSPELSGTFLGTCSCNPHRYTPELIWAEDPISLRCWGKIGDRVRNLHQLLTKKKVSWKPTWLFWSKMIPQVTEILIRTRDFRICPPRLKEKSGGGVRRTVSEEHGPAAGEASHLRLWMAWKNDSDAQCSVWMLNAPCILHHLSIFFWWDPKHVWWAKLEGTTPGSDLENAFGKDTACLLPRGKDPTVTSTIASSQFCNWERWKAPYLFSFPCLPYVGLPVAHHLCIPRLVPSQVIGQHDSQQHGRPSYISKRSAL